MLNGRQHLGPGCDPVYPADAYCVEGLRSGDPEAFRKIFQDLQPALLKRAKAMVSDHTLAEDAVQDTWLAVLRSIFRYEGRSSLKTWIFSILDNRARSIFRKAKRLARLSLEGWQESDLQQGPSAGFPGKDSQNVVEFLLSQLNQEKVRLSRQLAQALHQAIARLPTRQRRVFELRVLLGESAESVSSQLGITKANQRVLLHRARRSVRFAIAEPRIPGNGFLSARDKFDPCGAGRSV